MNINIGPDMARAIIEHETTLSQAAQQGVIPMEVIGPAVLLPDDEHYGLGAYQVWFPVECTVVSTDSKGDEVRTGHAQWAHVTPDGQVVYQDSINLEDYCDV